MFTQEFLAEMLGVRRTSITVVAHTLQQAGLIKYARGKIQVLNVEGLREAACECYESVKEHYAQLLGNGLPPPDKYAKRHNRIDRKKLRPRNRSEASEGEGVHPPFVLFLADALETANREAFDA
jgi:hypothetical protein